MLKGLTGITTRNLITPNNGVLPAGTEVRIRRDNGRYLTIRPVGYALEMIASYAAITCP